MKLKRAFSENLTPKFVLYFSIRLAIFVAGTALVSQQFGWPFWVTGLLTCAVWFAVLYLTDGVWRK